MTFHYANTIFIIIFTNLTVCKVNFMISYNLPGLYDPRRS